jgi:uncharacterized cysteine cluster protein YcgN (CxxCxxCC family)
MVKEIGRIEAVPFWKRKPLEALDPEEWESLCDGCARCCLAKLEDEESGAIAWTDVGCLLLDGETCRCRDYPGRADVVPDCVRLTPEAVRSLSWLPPSCAYRLVAEGRDLYWWHPLVSGDPETVHAAGVSVRGRTVPEADWPVERWEDRLVHWPMRLPARARSPGERGTRRSSSKKPLT